MSVGVRETVHSLVALTFLGQHFWGGGSHLPRLMFVTSSEWGGGGLTVVPRPQETEVIPRAQRSLARASSRTEALPPLLFVKSKHYKSARIILDFP